MSTTAGSVASVSKPLGETQKRLKIRGLSPVGSETKSKGPYANSISEGKKKDLPAKKQKHMDNKPVQEAKLDEDDLILVPGQGIKRKTGFVPNGKSRVDHEVEMAKSDLLQLLKNTKTVMMLVKDRTEDEGLEGWVQEKIIKAADYMNTLAEYLEGKRIQEMTGGVIAAGGVGEGTIPDNKKPAKPKSQKGIDLSTLRKAAAQATPVKEGAKVDRMVKHIAKSEREAGKSSEEAENIAWATTNKRGYLDNKNKKSK